MGGVAHAVRPLLLPLGERLLRAELSLPDHPTWHPADSAGVRACGRVLRRQRRRAVVWQRRCSDVPARRHRITFSAGAATAAVQSSASARRGAAFTAPCIGQKNAEAGHRASARWEQGAARQQQRPLRPSAAPPTQCCSWCHGSAARRSSRSAAAALFPPGPAPARLRRLSLGCTAVPGACTLLQLRACMRPACACR
jgi:hypothetical protein